MATGLGGWLLRGVRIDATPPARLAEWRSTDVFRFGPAIGVEGGGPA